MTVPSFLFPVVKTICASRSVVVGMLMLTAVCSSHATLFFTDQFNYTDGANLGAISGGGGTTWSVASGDVSQIQISSAATQTSPNSYATAAGRGVAVTPTGTRKQTGVPLNGATGIPVADGNIVYASFLLNIQVLPSSGNMRVAYLHNGAASSAAIEVVVSSTGQVGVQKKGSGTTFVSGTPVASTNTTHLVVMRYTFQNGNDEVAVWADPATNSYGVNPAPSPGASTVGGGSDMASAILQFFIEAPALTGPVFWMDEVRVGTNWAETVPASGSVAPTFVPVITQALLIPQGMVLRGTNGTPTSAYQVIATTNLALAASNWPAVATRAFDGSGNFDSTNPILAGSGRQFFRLLVGGTNPPAATAPSITNPPQSLTVAVGANANFLVGASGTAPLNYFWSLNTNTPVGVNSSTLALVSVTTNDAGAYRVIITNSVGSATSSVATLTVLVPPTITASPTNFFVASGGSATFNVTATGSATLSYQWYFNTNTAVANATNASLTLNPVNATNAGTYAIVVTNAVGSATSSVAVLTVFSAPVITAQPQSQSVTVSNDATFTVTAAGTAPLAYKWFFNTNTVLPNATNSSVTVTNAQATNAGTYSVIITNNYGAVTSSFATLTVSTAAVTFAQFNLAGFAWTTTGGGILAENNSAYRKVTNALDLANAINTAAVKVIEITTNLDLGWLEIGAAAQAVGPFRAHATPSLHPRLIQTGVSLLDIQGKDGLTIFSTNGATVRHACFNIKNSRNVIVRNLKFDEMWEWDEATKGNYDSKDWDFIDLGNGGGTGTTTNIWIDHCTFTKTYDGIVDIKGGANHVTLSWNKYVGDDGASNTNSFVWQQINTLESNKTAYAMYNSLRTASGFTPAEIVSIIQGQDKTHLAGANDGVANAGNAAENALISITFHHQWFQNCWDRCVPRLRGGNVHDFNIYADDSLALDAKRLRDAHGVNSSYSFNPVLNGSIATESGAILVENSIYQDCLTPLRNNQTDVSNPAYTGKIMALNSIYSFRTTGGTTNTYTGSSTNAPGDTYFGPVQAPVIAFSWNLPGNVLPYAYSNVMSDPNQLKSILTNATTGCGAGVLTWAKTNWLKTAY